MKAAQDMMSKMSPEDMQNMMKMQQEMMKNPAMMQQAQQMMANPAMQQQAAANGQPAAGGRHRRRTGDC